MVTKGYGLTVEYIDNSCPSDLEPYADAHRLEMVERDNYIYSVFGNYAISAVAFAIEHNFAKDPKSKYTDKLIFDSVMGNKELTEEEINKEVESFFATERARRLNWKRNSKKRCEDVN